jgi:hypothetical protein
MIFKDIAQFYKLGKQLGLSKREINNILLFKSKYPLILFLVVIALLSVLAFLFWDIALFLYANSKKPLYPSGTGYSSVKIQDFKMKKWKFLK